MVLTLGRILNNKSSHSLELSEYFFCIWLKYHGWNFMYSFLCLSQRTETGEYGALILIIRFLLFHCEGVYFPIPVNKKSSWEHPESMWIYSSLANFHTKIFISIQSHWWPNPILVIELQADHHFTEAKVNYCSLWQQLSRERIFFNLRFLPNWNWKH